MMATRLRVGVGQEHRVREHLVVEEVLARREHREPINHHQMTKGFGLIDLNGLKRALLVMQAPLDAQRKGAASGLGDLGKPVVLV